MNKQLFVYEFKNVIGNIFTIMFGIAFPIVMLMIFTRVFSKGLPEDVVLSVNSGIFLSMLMIVPMATMLIGYSAVYSQEMEQNVPLRLRLFGLKTQSVLTAKLLSNVLFLLLSTVIYMIVGFLGVKMYRPTILGLFLTFLVVLLLGGIFLVLSHGIANLCGRFSTTYAITMTLYFAFMILCGMMGVRVDQFPDFVQKIAKLFPMTYMNLNDGFSNVWQGKSFQSGGFFLSFAFLTLISVLVLLASQWKNRRR